MCCEMLQRAECIDQRSMEMLIVSLSIDMFRAACLVPSKSMWCGMLRPLEYSPSFEGTPNSGEEMPQARMMGRVGFDRHMLCGS